MGIHDRGSTYIPDLCNITWHTTWRGYTGDYGMVWSECNAIPNPYINLILLRWHIIFTFHCADTRLCVDVRFGCMPTLQATFAFSCSYTTPTFQFPIIYTPLYSLLTKLSKQITPLAGLYYPSLQVHNSWMNITLRIGFQPQPRL